MMKEHLAMAEEAKRLGEFSRDVYGSRALLSQEQLFESLKRMRDRLLRRGWKNMLAIMMPRPFGPRVVHVGVPEPIRVSAVEAADAKEYETSLLEHTRTRMQEKLDEINARIASDDPRGSRTRMSFAMRWNASMRVVATLEFEGVLEVVGVDLCARHFVLRTFLLDVTRLVRERWNRSEEALEVEGALAELRVARAVSDDVLEVEAPVAILVSLEIGHGVAASHEHVADVERMKRTTDRIEAFHEEIVGHDAVDGLHVGRFVVECEPEANFACRRRQPC